MMLRRNFPKLLYFTYAVFLFGMVRPQYFPATFLFTYLMMLVALMYLVSDVEYLAQHPKMEAVMERIRYNLRDVPRVDYKEISSDEEQDQEQEEQDQEENDEVAEHTSESDESTVANEQQPEDDEEEEQSADESGGLVKRRDRNPMGRLLDEVLA